MLLMLASKLALSLRERNRLLLSAGFAPGYPERRFGGPDFEAARSLIELILAGHEPWPALAVDRHWTMLVANRSVSPLLVDIDEALLEPPVNVLRLSLHPNGLAPKIVNYAEWRSHILARLQQQAEDSGDPFLATLAEELAGYEQPPATGDGQPSAKTDLAGLAVPLQLQAGEGILSFVSTTTFFGTPVDITLSELVIESFFPADEATASIIRRQMEQSGRLE